MTKLVVTLLPTRAAKSTVDKLRRDPSGNLVEPFQRHSNIDGLKSDESVDRNVERALDFLLGNGRFLGRDSP